MTAERDQRLLELEHDDHAGDRGEDQDAAHERVDAEGEPAHVAVMYARTASAPATNVAPVNQARRPRRSGGRVHPRREHREQRERPVQVVELVRRPMMAREKQEPEPDLRDEQRLREREQMRQKPARLALAVVRPGSRRRRPERRSEDREGDGMVDADHGPAEPSGVGGRRASRRSGCPGSGAGTGGVPSSGGGYGSGTCAGSGGFPSSGGGYGGCGSSGVTISVSCTGSRALRILSSAPASRSASSSSTRFVSCSSSTSRSRASRSALCVALPDRLAERLQRRLPLGRKRVEPRPRAPAEYRRVEPRPPHLGGGRGLRATVGRQPRGVLRPQVGAAAGRLGERGEQDSGDEQRGRCPTPSSRSRRGRSRRRTPRNRGRGA